MRIAILSDIHANMDAFREVLSDIERTDIDAIVSLGDNIGYGPEPEPVLKQIRQLEIPSVMGNHELAVVDDRIVARFNPLARQSIQKTIEMLSEDAIDYIHRLDYYMILHDCRFVHGFPPDSATTYLSKVPDRMLVAAFGHFAEPLCFIGHTHTLEMVVFSGSKASRKPLEQGITPLDPDNRYLINCGSVGQPRDPDNRAKYIIWDSGLYRLEVRYVPYDISAVVAKILSAGLPKAHATRLW